MHVKPALLQSAALGLKRVTVSLWVRGSVGFVLMVCVGFVVTVCVGFVVMVCVCRIGGDGVCRIGGDGVCVSDWW